MRTRTSLIAAIFLVALAALGVFYYATTSVINRAFDTIEARDVNQNTDRAVSALQSKVDALVFKAVDWASWDDTYAFVENHNQAYIDSNLQASALQSLGIHFMLFYNQSGRLVYSEAIDPDSGNDTQIPASMLNNFTPGGPLMAPNVDSEHKGLISLPTGVVQFVSLPILKSDNSGPVHGTLVFAIWLTPDEVTQLSTLTGLNIQYWRLNDAKIPADVTKAVGSTPVSGHKEITKASSKKIVGYQTIADAYGKPAIVARIEQPRDIHGVATSAVDKFLTLILLDTLGAAVIAAVLYVIIRRRDRTIALKNEFFSIASHELRTPLTVIRDYAQLMKFQFSKQVADPKFDHMVDNIDMTGAQLIGLVNVFLDAARMEKGKIPFEVKPFSVGTLVTALEPEIAATAAKKKLAFTVICPPEIPQAMGDDARVRQIILNVIGNAMKFTDTGGITLKVETAANMVRVYISDTGRGMDEAAQKVLFKRFSQVRTGDARIGSGLGLFISKKLIEQMGGTIQVESSAPGIGTSISFSLPIAPGAVMPPVAGSPTASTASQFAPPPPTPVVATEPLPPGSKPLVMPTPPVSPPPVPPAPTNPTPPTT